MLLAICGAVYRFFFQRDGRSYGGLKSFTGTIDSIVIYKAQHKLLLYSSGGILKTYAIVLGGSPIGHKRFEGDQKTPEGSYKINAKSPHSRYHKNLGISYPSEADIAYAEGKGKSAGGDIKIHGMGPYLSLIGNHLLGDWTAGCIALSNDDIDEFYQVVALGMPIEIKP